MDAVRWGERVADLRRSYERAGLAEPDLAADPVAQFRVWFHDALTAGLPEPNAMILATATADGEPSARIVLLKGFDDRGFAFFSNAGSRKGRDIAANPRATLVFPWHPLERQVTVAGAVAAMARPEVASYFASRPRASQLGAWASRQSSVVASRAELEQRYAEVAARWPEGADVPLPDFWTGWRVVPRTVEFWQGRQGRMHDRLRYRHDAAAPGEWVVERLAP